MTLKVILRFLFHAQGDMVEFLPLRKWGHLFLSISKIIYLFVSGVLK